MIKHTKIINYYLGTSHGIRGTARHFNLPITYVGNIINKYKKEHGIR